MAGNQELKGFCVQCHALYCWSGKPRKCDALCPHCGMPLAQARKRITGKYAITNTRPAQRGAA